MDDLVCSENCRWIFWLFGNWLLGFRQNRLGWDLPAMDSGGSGKGAWWTMLMPRSTQMEVTEGSGSGWIRIRVVLGGSDGVGIYVAILTVGSRTKVQCCQSRVGAILTISFSCTGF